MLEKPPLSVHLIECGQGNMTLLVTPTATVVYDCRITSEEEARILSYLRVHVPERTVGGEKARWIDWFICSHRDEDHIFGLRVLNEHFPIRGIVDPGIPSGSPEGDQNQYYMCLRRQVRDKYGPEADVVPEPSTSPWRDFGGVRLYCLCSGKGLPRGEDGHYGNNVFQVAFAGNRILLTGDSDWRAWKERIVPKFKDSGLLKTTVLVASHHGSRSFFVETSPWQEEDECWGDSYEEHLFEHIKPSMTLISCGPQGKHNHPNPKARNRYKDATKHRQVYLTRNVGTFVGQFHHDGSWTVTPSRFLRGWNYDNFVPEGKTMTVTCKASRPGGRTFEVKSGDAVQVGHNLEFQIDTSGGLADGMNGCYGFEVSNGGRDEHADHDEIYCKERDSKIAPNKFGREISYLGTHLLRCEASNGGASPRGQKVFIVKGIP